PSSMVQTDRHVCRLCGRQLPPISPHRGDPLLGRAPPSSSNSASSHRGDLYLDTEARSTRLHRCRCVRSLRATSPIRNLPTILLVVGAPTDAQSMEPGQPLLARGTDGPYHPASAMAA